MCLTAAGSAPDLECAKVVIEAGQGGKNRHATGQPVKDRRGRGRPSEGQEVAGLMRRKVLMGASR